MGDFSKYIIIISHVPILITCGYALITFGKQQTILKVFSCFLFLSYLIQFASLLFWFNRMNNMPLLHAYVGIGFLLLALFYKKVLEGFISAVLIYSVAAVFLILTFLNSLFLQSVHTFNSYALTLESVLLIIFSLTTYILLLDETVKEKRRSMVSSINWINSGIFIYYVSNLLIFYFSGYISRYFSREFNRYTWVLHSFFSVVMYTFFFIGLWKRPKD
jgi:hypothetical protein